MAGGAGWRVYSVRARLKDILRQYELRERHFECVIRSKELEVLLSRARAAEQKQLAEGEKVRAERVEEEARPHQLFVIRYPYVNLQTRPPTHSPIERGFFLLLFAESASSKGTGRRAEGPDDARGAADIVLQGGTLVAPFFFHDPPLLQRRTPARAHTHPFSPVSFNVLSDRDRTFTAQRRAHPAPIRIPSRRAGEEGWQDPEGGKRRCGEWDKLTLTLNRRRRPIQIPMYPTRIHTHTPFSCFFFPFLL